ncbi:hypothetical protein J6590_019255 [Homalodisca vitripennis]|nr:hypothetical protein J6590_019255 [Homalodisca vitripennis]
MLTRDVKTVESEKEPFRFSYSGLMGCAVATPYLPRNTIPQPRCFYLSPSDYVCTMLTLTIAEIFGTHSAALRLRAELRDSTAGSDRICPIQHTAFCSVVCPENRPHFLPYAGRIYLPAPVSSVPFNKQVSDLYRAPNPSVQWMDGRWCGVPFNKQASDLYRAPNPSFQRMAGRWFGVPFNKQASDLYRAPNPSFQRMAGRWFGVPFNKQASDLYRAPNPSFQRMAGRWFGVPFNKQASDLYRAPNPSFQRMAGRWFGVLFNKQASDLYRVSNPSFQRMNGRAVSGGLIQIKTYVCSIN